MLGKNNATNSHRRLKNKNGYISLLILLITFFLSWIGIMTYMKVSSQERIVQYEALKTKVSFAADSGLEIAEAELSADSEWEGGTYDLSECKIVVTVERQSESFRINVRAEARTVNQVRFGTLVYDDYGQLFLSDYGYIYE